MKHYLVLSCTTGMPTVFINGCRINSSRRGVEQRIVTD